MFACATELPIAEEKVTDKVVKKATFIAQW
jgi:hypothetical protein